MNGDDSISKIFVWTFFHTNVFHHIKKLVLGQKFLNRFNQILVALCVISDDFTHFWNNIEGIFSVKFSEKRVLNLAEFQTHESSSWFQDSQGFRQGFSCSWNISQSKWNCVSVESIVCERQLFGISTDELNLFVRKSHRISSFLTLIQHTLVNIKNSAFNIFDYLKKILWWLWLSKIL